MEISTGVFLLFLMPSLILAQTCSYSQFGSDHTMCKYNAKACPPGLLASGTTQADITAVLKAHNTLRNKVANGGQTGQPSSSNMEEMKWDSELATVAQRWAEQCTFAHDGNRRTTTYKYVGQNVAITGSSVSGGTTDFTQAINLWYNEVTDPGFDKNNIEPFKYVSGAGHYTQVAWATSNRVGCGYAAYKSDGWYRKLYVCNYGPAGNMISGSMYKQGTAASACAKGKSSTYNGLCNS